MPWFWAYLPSIQLAIVADELAAAGISSDVFEFYADLVEDSGIHLYKAIANSSGYVGELLFSQFYFEGHKQQYRTERPNLGLATPEIEASVFDFMSPIIEDRLDRWVAEVQWADYDAVCFSLTASQTAASMAMAQRIKRAHPDIVIVFGGTSCAGEMGRATARICPEVDVVVHAEAETALPSLIEALRGERALADVPGISWRRGEAVMTNERARLHALARTRGSLSYDSYFKRIAGNRALQAHGAWIPFESSRGCWYGEKSQCTFCGLNEIIQYRQRGSGGLVEELEDYSRRYGVERFFAVDLIMPRSFFKEFLPAVAARGRGWTIFYEIKSNMNRQEIELLAAGGVRWIQPGIESLDDDILRLMRKGVTAAHNIQTLKWTRELGILASWNLITGFPRERAKSYHAMARMFPRLHHLLPPVGLGDFEVHRFSPYFEEPAAHGIELLGAFPAYRAVYPVEPADLDALVYRHAYRLVDPPDADAPAARQALVDAVAAWRAAAKRGAGFTFEERSDGSVALFDTRLCDRAVERVVTGAAARLLLFLDEMKPEARLANLFRSHDEPAWRALGGEAGVAALLDSWAADGTVLRISGFILGLAVRQALRIEDEDNGRREENAEQTDTDADGNDGPHQGAALRSGAL